MIKRVIFATIKCCLVGLVMSGTASATEFSSRFKAAEAYERAMESARVQALANFTHDCGAHGGTIYISMLDGTACVVNYRVVGIFSPSRGRGR